MLSSNQETESIDYIILAFHTALFNIRSISNLLHVLLSNDLLLVDKEPIIVELFHNLLCICFRFY
jgi:hypothetical protein